MQYPISDMELYPEGVHPSRPHLMASPVAPHGGLAMGLVGVGGVNLFWVYFHIECRNFGLETLVWEPQPWGI